MFFSFFLKKQDLTFHASCLHWSLLKILPRVLSIKFLYNGHARFQGNWYILSSDRSCYWITVCIQLSRTVKLSLSVFNFFRMKPMVLRQKFVVVKEITVLYQTGLKFITMKRGNLARLNKDKSKTGREPF